MHDHTWDVAVGPGRWTAACADGLAVIVGVGRPAGRGLRSGIVEAAAHWWRQAVLGEDGVYP